MTHAHVTCGVCGLKRFVYRNDTTPLGSKIYCPTCKINVRPIRETRTDGEKMDTPLKTKAPLKYKKPKPKRGPAKKSPTTETRKQTTISVHETKPVPYVRVGVLEMPSRDSVIDRVCQLCAHARILHRRSAFGWYCRECDCEVLDHDEARKRKQESEG